MVQKPSEVKEGTSKAKVPGIFLLLLAIPNSILSVMGWCASVLGTLIGILMLLGLRDSESDNCVGACIIEMMRVLLAALLIAGLVGFGLFSLLLIAFVLQIKAGINAIKGKNWKRSVVYSFIGSTAAIVLGILLIILGATAKEIVFIVIILGVLEVLTGAGSLLFSFLLLKAKRSFTDTEG